MSRDPLRERDLRNSESILDRIIENDAREAAAADRRRSASKAGAARQFHRNRAHRTAVQRIGLLIINV